MRYGAVTARDRRAMLDVIGAPDVEALFQSVPADVRMKRPLKVDGPLAEQDLLGRLDAMKGPAPRVALVGAGLYRHFVPANVDALCARSEWVTSYTPYQPELAQGTLAMYYEFQTYVAQLTGQEIANGGMYDGSTATTEAVLMAMRLKPNAKVVYASEGVHPDYLAVLRTYLRFQDVALKMLPIDPATGRTTCSVPEDDQKAAAAVVIQSPNFFGAIENLSGVANDAFVISVCTEALSLAIVPPIRANVATGDFQSFGVPPQLGGPTAGFFATKKDYVRQTPGRLVGKTVDMDGREALCITLATREQFIRREKATSNICTASGLMCLRSTVYLSLLGRKGLENLATQNAKAARWFAEGLKNLGLSIPFTAPYFNEFVVDCSAKPKLYDKLAEKDFLLGVPLSRWFPQFKDRYLVNVTETHVPRLRDMLEEVKTCAHDL